MKYADLCADEKARAEFNENTENQWQIKFDKDFYHFKNVHTPLESDPNTCWKAHISLEPEDLEKAWDLIYPMLAENAPQFKVIDAPKMNQMLQDNQQKLAVMSG